LFKTLKVEESNIFSQTKKEFKNVTNHIEKGFDLLKGAIDIITKKEAVGESYKRFAVYILSFRILRILRSAYWCMLCGYYDIAGALFRIAFETHLLLYFLSEREKEAKEWFEGKEFRPAYMRRQVDVSYDAVYKAMSDFVHPKIRTSVNWFFRDENGKPAEFWITKFNFARASEVAIGLMCMLGGTLSCIPLAFPKTTWFKLQKEKVEMEQEAKRILKWNKKTTRINKKLREPLEKK